MHHLLELTHEQLQNWFVEAGLPAYRARQVLRWIFKNRAEGFEQMTDLSPRLRVALAEQFIIWSTRIAAHQKADDGSEKLLLQLDDGGKIECVLLRDDRAHCTICISTQVGCSMGCVFCATGLDGMTRNLTSGEIVEQMLHLQRLLRRKERLSNIVVMGMGEPLLNLDALLPALDVGASPKGLGIGVRRVTISTVGLPKGIRRLAEMNCPYHLAVSLHAADDALRNRLVPANRDIGIQAILAAADEYFARTGRRITFEYVLLSGINDQAAHARRLVELMRGRPALINLIPYNPVAGLPYKTPTAAATAEFMEILDRGGLTSNIRYRKGSRIQAACGQLRRGKSAAEY
ncbi:MAG: 23S rRNA (adenine(2503)-C(2))-methyltransferase RlmN [Thermoguttaceae bacterium]